MQRRELPSGAVHWRIDGQLVAGAAGCTWWSTADGARRRMAASPEEARELAEAAVRRAAEAAMRRAAG